MSDHKDAFDYMISLVPILTAAFVAWVVFLQYKVSKEKVRLDLYNRRFDIYSRTIDFFQALLSYDASKPKDNFNSLHAAFVKSYMESQYLFDKGSGVYEILDEMHKKSFKITGFLDISKTLSSAPDAFLRGYQEKDEALHWIADAISRLGKAIAPYLNFHKISA